MSQKVFEELWRMRRKGSNGVEVVENEGSSVGSVKALANGAGDGLSQEMWPSWSNCDI